MNGVLEESLMDTLNSLQEKAVNVSPDYRSSHVIMAGCGNNPCSGSCGRACSDDCAATCSGTSA
jgi:hypothetical protein